MSPGSVVLPGDHTNSLGEQETEPPQTDNGPKQGDRDVPDQDAVELPATGGHEAAGLCAAVLAEAMRHRGTIEDPVGSNRQPFGKAYGWDGVAWCNIFVSRVGFAVAGDYSLLGKFASTVACARWWDQQGRFGAEPRAGATVFFDWDGGHDIAAIDHIGLVVAPLGNGLVRTIEGNAAIPGRSDGVWVHDRSTRFIVGFGYPGYSGATAVGATALKAAAPSVSAAPAPLFPGLLRHGSTGPAVTTLQQRLRVRGWKITVDGDFGPETDRVVRGFQKDKGLEVDGEVGPKTWTALWSTPIT